MDIEIGEEVAEMTTLLKARISIIKIVPLIGGYFVKIFSFINDVWNKKYSYFNDVEIETLLPYDEIVIRKILSDAIFEVASNFEKKLSDSKTRSEIKSYFNKAVIKLHKSLKTYASRSEEPLTEIDILRQNLYHNDIFACRFQEDSRNYKFIH